MQPLAPAQGAMGLGPTLLPLCLSKESLEIEAEGQTTDHLEVVIAGTSDGCNHWQRSGRQWS